MHIHMEIVWEIGCFPGCLFAGPSHFAANSLTRPLGVTIARQQCLQARGWKVLSVTHGAWTAAKTQQGRVQLLRDILMQRSG